VPTSLSYHGNLYFGNLGRFPVDPGSESIWKLTPSGELKIVASGLTTVLGTTWDERGRLYALESVTAAGFPFDPTANPFGTGRVVRIEPNGAQSTVVDGLTVPTAMTFGPDGALYISNLGFGAPAGAGEILRATVP
jgi:sugar lactone lactonase YvrE